MSSSQNPQQSGRTAQTKLANYITFRELVAQAYEDTIVAFEVKRPRKWMDRLVDESLKIARGEFLRLTHRQAWSWIITKARRYLRAKILRENPVTSNNGRHSQKTREARVVRKVIFTQRDPNQIALLPRENDPAQPKDLRAFFNEMLDQE